MISRRKWNLILLFLIVEGFIYFRIYAQAPKFANRVDLGLIESNLVTEASGIAASRRNPGVLWTHNDSGDKNRLYALNAKGKHLGIYTIAGVTARDWEDLAIGPGPITGQSYLYIGDIGNNEKKFDYQYIYRIPELKVDSSQAPVDTTLLGAEIIVVQYPDANHDAEALMVDPLTKDIYIAIKRDSSSRVYRASYPQSTRRNNILKRVATLPFGWVVAGDISPAGDEILIKTYVAIYYWTRSPEQKLWEAFNKAPVMVPYLMEPQGEAVGWEAHGKGYYTISEEFGGIPAHLYFYPRISGKSAGIKP